MKSGWHIAANKATCSSASWEASMDVTTPSQGVHWSVDANSKLRTCLLGIEFKEAETHHAVPLIDQYVRGDDVVATYETKDPLHLRPQIYWRFQASTGVPDASGMVIQVSLQTNRLDARPTLLLKSNLPSGTLRAIDAKLEGDASAQAESSLLLFSPTDEDYSLVIAHQPADLVSYDARGSADEGWQIETQLLGEHLEKGVIRRSLTGVWQVVREGDVSCARQLFAEFLAAPPPLTV